MYKLVEKVRPINEIDLDTFIEKAWRTPCNQLYIIGVIEKYHYMFLPGDDSYGKWIRFNCGFNETFIKQSEKPDMKGRLRDTVNQFEGVYIFSSLGEYFENKEKI